MCYFLLVKQLWTLKANPAIQILVPLITGHVVAGKSCHLSEPPFLLTHDGDGNVTYLLGLLGGGLGTRTVCKGHSTAAGTDQVLRKRGAAGGTAPFPGLNHGAAWTRVPRCHRRECFFSLEPCCVPGPAFPRHFTPHEGRTRDPFCA